MSSDKRGENGTHNYLEFEEKLEDEELDGEELTEDELSASPFYELINTLCNYSFIDAYYRILADVIDGAVSSIEGVRQDEVPLIPDEEARDDMIEVLVEIREAIDELSEMIFLQREIEGLDSVIKKLEELNEEFLLLHREVVYSPDEEAMERLLNEIIAEIPVEAYYTVNYVKIEERAQEFASHKISKEEFLQVLDEVWNLLESSGDKYKKLNLSSESMTPEVALAERLLIEGMDEWEAAIVQLSGSCEEGDEMGIFRGVDMAYSANRKLVIMQHIEKRT